MNISKTIRSLSPAGIIVFSLLSIAHAQSTLNVLYQFSGSPDGAQPGALITDASGNLYSTTAKGGANNLGTVFKLSPSAAGSWTETVLFSFPGGAAGETPQNGLAFDHAGNLYGAAFGGASFSGIIFQLAPSQGEWKETILHTFSGGIDGSFPGSGPTIDAAGNLYGTTLGGGNRKACNGAGCGVVYRLSFQTGVGWRETILHVFSNIDGNAPLIAPLLDASGNLWGTTLNGGWVSDRGICGRTGCGVVYKLSRANGQWTETIIHKFVDGPQDGATPSGLARDGAGNLFGITDGGGFYRICSNGSGCGVVYELSPNSDGSWSETLLTIFNGRNGAHPTGTPHLDAVGNVYGTAGTGGSQDTGIVFKLSQTAGTWTFNPLYDAFTGNTGEGPMTGVIFGPDGNLYGSLQSNGTSQAGSIFSLTP